MAKQFEILIAAQISHLSLTSRDVCEWWYSNRNIVYHHIAQNFCNLHVDDDDSQHFFSAIYLYLNRMQNGCSLLEIM